MNTWFELYHIFISFILDTLTQIWSLMSEHFWTLFPLIISFVCGVISFILYVIMRVIRNRV